MRGRSRRLVVAVAAVFLLAACGGDSEEEVPEPSEAAEQLENLEPPEVEPPSTEDESAEDTSAEGEPSTEEAEEPGDEPATGGGSIASPCDVVTAADVEQVLGEPVESVDVPGLESVMCTYQTADGIVDGTEVSVTVDTSMSFDDLVAFNTSTFSDAATQPVDGLGEQALSMTTESQEIALLFVRAGGANLLFGVIDLDMTPDEALDVETQIARIAVERL